MFKKTKRDEYTRHIINIYQDTFFRSTRRIKQIKEEAIEKTAKITNINALSPAEYISAIFRIE